MKLMAVIVHTEMCGAYVLLLYRYGLDVLRHQIQV